MSQETSPSTADTLVGSGSALPRAWGGGGSWQVRLRWWVPPAIGIGVVLGWWLGFRFEVLPILLVAMGVLVYNGVFALRLRRGKRDDGRFQILQVSLDYAAMFLLIHFTGCGASPLVFFFVLHVIFAAILLRPGSAWLFAGIATVGLGLLILGESLGWLTTHPVTFGSEAVNLTERPGHLAVIWIFFAASVFITAALTTALMSRLRQQEKNLMNERSRFMLQVAHNIRAPLAATLSMLDVLRGGYLGEVVEKQNEYLERMDRRLKTLNASVGEFLDLAKNRQAVEKLECGPVKPKPLAERIETTFGDEAERKGLVLRVTVPEDLPEIAGDAVRLEQMLENLASNAIKYTPAGGKVEVTFKRGEDDDRPITIEVRDTGIGIPVEEQHLLFSEFFRAENAREVEEIGTGLGLAIVKHIVDLHQGRIGVQSRKGSGTTFTIDLPAYLPN